MIRPLDHNCDPKQSQHFSSFMLINEHFLGFGSLDHMDHKFPGTSIKKEYKGINEKHKIHKTTIIL